MSEAKHTPGPWTVFEHSWSDTSIWTHDSTVATLSIKDEATEDTQAGLEARMAANARLIAAAPDLLEALREVLKEAIDDYYAEKDPDGVLDAAYAAIAKATGKEGA